MRAFLIAVFTIRSVAADADPAVEAEADRAYRAAAELASAGDRATAIAAFEAVGTLRPINRWTDNAWSEVARLAEQERDFARARAALEQVLATTDDGRMRDRARGSLVRLVEMTSGGTRDAVAAEHEKLVALLHASGDPTEALSALAALVRAHPMYARATAVRLALAHGHERDGAHDDALAWAREAYAGSRPDERPRAGADLVRIALRVGALDEAEDTLDRLAAPLNADRATIDDLRDDLATARHRAAIRIGLWIALALVASAGVVMLRRTTGTWRATVRALATPPIEVLYMLPIGVVLIVVSHTGNVLVAAAVRAIVTGGLAVSWLSGVLLEASRLRGYRIGVARAVIHVAIAALAVAASTYLAVDHHRMIDLVIETWRGGPQR